ncbi:uncharacterized protein LOC132722900 isoform X6 [Ruditapes philippinarum]|uniref:uncharacterized protein LOC132722900 isoform X6 n=1 Tax=Ruditapes philippinarum TaxID=129788 RepID=UPI00295B7869|nr:uncharacterized protein LOC132722900 isoform X6 [Ruditapes philippinarum]
MSDGSLQRMSARNKKFCEGWLEHKAHRPTGYRYERLFGLLEGNVMYIFSTDAPSQETQIGNLTIDSNTEFIKGKGHPSKGYKFDLNTGTRLNRFKTKKSTERELWRGYVIGISKGDVPNDLDLLDSEVKEIKQNVAAFHGSEVVDYDPKRSSIASGVSQRSQVSRGKDSGVVSLGGMSRQSGSSSDDSRSRRSVASTVSGTVDHGGPTVVHKFYNDHNRDQKPPSWFIPHCSREMAEKVLERAVTENYGNTLMRESTSYLSNGSYVISKINVNKRDGRVEFEHFEVIRTSQGYKVNVQNHHQPMKCLQDVMDYFVGTSGGSTRPLEVNDPTFLAQDTPGYSTQIHFKRPESWKWPPQDSREEPVPDGRHHQYYDNHPSSPPPDDNRFRNIEGSQTVSAGILRNQRPLPSPGANERKSVGWSSVINTPPPIPGHSKTFAGSRTRQAPVPSMTELTQRSHEADQIEKFDTMLSGFESGFERNSVYVNSSSSKKGVTSPVCPIPPPPPPTAHQVPAPPRSYVNVNPASVSSPSSASTRNSIPKASSTGLSALSHTSSPSVNLRNSSSVASNHTSATQNRPTVSKSLSENQLRSMRSPDSPKNFPTWGTPKQSVSLQNQTKRPESVAGVSVSVKEEPVAGIDDSTQGGVSTLRNRFESSSSNSPAQHKAGRSRSSLPPRWSVSSQLSETLGELDDLYEYLSEDGVDVTNTNIQATNTNNSRHLQNSQSMIINSNTNNQSLLTVGRAQSFTNAPSQPTSDRRQRLPVQEDDLYDDTVIEQQQESAERKVQFQQKRQSSVQTPAQCGRNDMRRKTEPTLSISKTEFEEKPIGRLNQSFKNKLEGLFGGSPAPAAQRPVSNKGIRELPATPINRQLSEDHEYQELPEIIPDAVTYVNDKFNVD